MPKRTCLCLVGAATALLFSGCSSDDQPDSGHHTAATTTTTSHQKKNDDDDVDHDMASPPHVGMTKAQVLAKYGQPHERQVTDYGENWSYVLNAAAVGLSGLNPFGSGATEIRIGVLIFGKDGRVTSFTWPGKT
jgi:outer membrane protein assembly factor BamE (lipoprotein component of BamABCDE complex)